MSRHKDGLAYFVTDREALDLVVDGVLMGSKPARELTKKIVKVQRKLQRAVDDDAWRIYLRLEELVNERADMQVELLLRWGDCVHVQRLRVPGLHHRPRLPNDELPGRRQRRSRPAPEAGRGGLGVSIRRAPPVPEDGAERRRHDLHLRR